MRRALAIAVVVSVAAPCTAAAQDAERRLQRDLAAAMRQAGSSSGAYVTGEDGRQLFAWRSTSTRILASNTKLYTTAAVLGRFGAERTLETEVLGDGELDAAGVWRGNLYLRGAGDPAFGSAAHVRRNYGAGGTVDDLAAQVSAAGIRRVSGRVYGDETLFDSLRGGPDSGYRVSGYVGPLSALAYNRGLANESGSAYQSNPPAFAAGRLDDALRSLRVSVSGAPRAGSTPATARRLAATASPPVSRLVQITNKRSDNLFAEVLLKRLAARAPGDLATTREGAAAARRAARRLGASPALADGSGLSRSNRDSPREVVALLRAARGRPWFQAFDASLAVAGRDGTLHDRMRSGPANRNCRGKTGTLSNVSALSGYCRTRAGEVVAFSILMNAVSPPSARRLQDRMAQAIAGYQAAP